MFESQSAGIEALIADIECITSDYWELFRHTNVSMTHKGTHAATQLLFAILLFSLIMIPIL